MDETSAAVLRNGLERARWAVADLWAAAIGVGGDFSPADIEAITTGRRQASPAEHDILAATLNDHFVARGEDHPVRYWDDLPNSSG